MTYQILGQNLHALADQAKEYFRNDHGASKFKCEAEVQADLPLKPTWQATLPGGYLLCIEVRESPFSPTLYQFVGKCANAGLPVRLWVVIPKAAAIPSFASELKEAREFGVGVLQIAEDGTAPYVFARPVASSLFGLKGTDLSKVPTKYRDEVKNAESTFREGSPDQGCQAICQALEQLTRKFAEHTYSKGLWRHPHGATAHTQKFFHNSAWAGVLEELEERLEIQKVKPKSPDFSKQAIVKARSHTDWRNAVSHKPRNFKELKVRDAKLRTMYEATRDTLVEWYRLTKPFKLA